MGDVGPIMTANPSALSLLRQGRARELLALGSRPTWSPFGRRAWDRRRRAIGEWYLRAALDIAIDEGTLTPAGEREMREVWL